MPSVTTIENWIIWASGRHLQYTSGSGSLNAWDLPWPKLVYFLPWMDSDVRIKVTVQWVIPNCLIFQCSGIIRLHKLCLQWRSHKRCNWNLRFNFHHLIYYFSDVNILDTPWLAWCLYFYIMNLYLIVCTIK